MSASPQQGREHQQPSSHLTPRDKHGPDGRNEGLRRRPQPQSDNISKLPSSQNQNHFRKKEKQPRNNKKKKKKKLSRDCLLLLNNKKGAIRGRSATTGGRVSHLKSETALSKQFRTPPPPSHHFTPGWRRSVGRLQFLQQEKGS